MILMMHELVCAVLCGISIFMVCFILFLSATTTTAKQSLGTKIFIVNVMLVDLVYASCAFYSHFQLALPEIFLDPWSSLVGYEVHSTINRWTMLARSLYSTIFTCSMIPMTAMSTLACYRPKTFTGKTAAKYFAALVLFADMIPALFVLLCVVLRNLKSDTPTTLYFNIEPRADYTALYFFLYFLEISLIAVALRTLYVKTALLMGSNGGASAAFTARRTLRSLLLFSVAPSVLQVPYAIRQITGLFAAHLIYCHPHCEGDPGCVQRCGRFWLDLHLEVIAVVYVILAVKPSIDAGSTLLFLGEYRKSGAAVLRKLRWCVEELLPSHVSSVHPAEGANANGTATPMPSTFPSAQFAQSNFPG